MKHFLPGTEVQRYTAQNLSIKLNLGQVQRYRGTQLEFTYYFTDVQEFLLKIDQGTEVHRYRAKNLPEMKIFLPGTEVQRYTAQNLSIKFNLGQVQRYRGTQLKFSCYFTDVKDFLLIIYPGTEVHRYRTQNLPKMKLFWPGTEVQRYRAQISSKNSNKSVK